MRLCLQLTLTILLAAGLGLAPACAQTAAAADSAAVASVDTVVTASPVPTLTFATDAVSPTAAVLMSAVFPGWGQLTTDDGWRAVAAFAFETWFLSRAIMFERKGLRYKKRLTGLPDEEFHTYYHTYSKEYFEAMHDNAWWAGGALFIIALDAYVGTHLHRFDQDRTPVPEGWDPAEVPQPIELPREAPGGAPLLQWSLNF